MATYVVPNTDLKILYNVPLDIDNKYSIAFTSRAQQELYFESKIKYSFAKFSYQREKRNYITVGTDAELLYDCNYLMFRNTAFGSRWFYAFITGVEYVSNNVSRISYVIDELQTWLLDYNYQNCYIKRTHTVSDDFGANLTPEPFNIDDYVYASYADLTTMGELVVIIGVADAGPNVQGRVYDGIYGGLNLYVFLQSDAGGIDSFLADYIQSPNSIVTMYLVPKLLTDLIPNIQYGQPLPQFSSPPRTTVTLTPLTIQSTTSGNYLPEIDGYRPKNKKLYSYPYNFLKIDNGTQETLSLRYELFSTPTTLIQGVIYGTISNPVELVFIPSNYKNNYVLSNSEDVLTMGDYPQISWNNDTYQTWISTHRLQIGKQIGSSVLSLMQGVFRIGTKMDDFQGKANALKRFNVGVEGAFDIAQTIWNDSLEIANAMYLASKQADTVRGNISSSSVLISSNRKKYHQARVCIRHELAEIIDNFFTVYGYEIDKIGTPNRLARPHWTYIQTANCLIRGDLPTDAKAYIEKIHDRGITWWRNADEVGNYGLDNRPASARSNEIDDSILEKGVVESGEEEKNSV